MALVGRILDLIQRRRLRVTAGNRHRTALPPHRHTAVRRLFPIGKFRARNLHQALQENAEVGAVKERLDEGAEARAGQPVIHQFLQLGRYCLEGMGLTVCARD